MGNQDTDEQKTFEIWFCEEYGYIDFSMTRNGVYKDRVAYLAWRRWQLSIAYQRSYLNLFRQAARQSID